MLVVCTVYKCCLMFSLWLHVDVAELLFDVSLLCQQCQRSFHLIVQSSRTRLVSVTPCTMQALCSWITYHRHFVTNVSNSVLFSMLFVVFFSVTTRILRRSLDIVSRYKVSFYYQVDLIQSCLPRPRRVDAFTMMTVVWRLSVCPVSEPVSRMEAHIKLVIGRK